jgi:hypothetical protein
MRTPLKHRHILASTAKRIYGAYWSEYFKFSFVRNPWDRMISLARFPRWSGVSVSEDSIDLSAYLEKFSDRELDWRSHSANEKLKPPIPEAVYLNILNEELDFIGRFEDLHEDFGFVCDKVGLQHKQLPHVEKFRQSKRKPYCEYYNDETRQLVADKYAKDIAEFGYKFKN